MRCKACNVLLEETELTRKDKLTGQFIENLKEEALRLGLEDEADIDNYITQKQQEIGA